MNPTLNATGISEIRSWREIDGVQWKGRRSDVFEQISSAHVLVHPSHYGEGLPKSDS